MRAAELRPAWVVIRSVKRVLVIGMLAAAGLWTTSAQAVTHPPRAAFSHYVCRQAQNPQHREISVTAVMRPLHGTQHMAIKFSLLREAAGENSFHHVHVGDLDKWISPKDPTLGQRPADVWKLDKVVSNLAGPDVYRLKATFRWTGARHRVLGETSRQTPVCVAD